MNRKMIKNAGNAMALHAVEAARLSSAQLDGIVGGADYKLELSGGCTTDSKGDSCKAEAKFTITWGK